MTVEQQLQYLIDNMVTKNDIQEFEQSFTKIINERISKSEKLLLDEMGRQFNYFDKEISKSNSTLQILSEEINTTRYSNETVERLLQEVLELRARIEKLENNKIA